MSKDGLHAVLISTKPLMWVRDREQILVLDEQRREIHILQGAEAVVWLWLTQVYSYPRILGLLTTMLDLPFDQTEELLRAIFQNWRRTSLLDIEV